MENINVANIVAVCPECSANFAVRWDELSEEQQCMMGFFCPKCGTFVKFGDE